MKIKVKTNLVVVKVTDFTSFEGGFMRHELPRLSDAVKAVIDETIKLHNKVKENTNETS